MHIDLITADPGERAALLALLGPRVDLREVALARAGRTERGDTDAMAVIWVHGRADVGHADVGHADGGSERGASRGSGDATAHANGAGGPRRSPLREVLAAHLDAGGRVLLSGAAAGLAAELAQDGPFALPGRPADDETGLLGLPGEPVMHRAGGGLELRRQHGTGLTDASLCPHRPWPRAGRVLAVARGPVFCIGRTPALVEYAIGAGRLLALGLDVPFRDGDPLLRESRARFFGDLFDYLASDAAAERAIGCSDPTNPPGVALVAPASASVPFVAAGEPRPADDDPGWQDIPRPVTRCQVLTSGSCDTATLLPETGQITAWARATQILAWLGTFYEGGAVPVWTAIRAHPRGLLLVAPAGLEGWLSPATDGDGFVLQWSNRGGAPIALEVLAWFELRLAGYPTGIAGSVRVGTARHGAVAMFQSERVGVRAALVADQRPRRAWVREAEGGAIGVGRCFDLAPGQDLLLSFGGRAPEWLAGPGEDDGAAPDRTPIELTPPAVDLGDGLAAAVAAARAVVGRKELLRLAPGIIAPVFVPARWLGPIPPPGPNLPVAGALGDAERWLAVGAGAAVLGALELAIRHRDADGRVPDTIWPSGYVGHAHRRVDPFPDPLGEAVVVAGAAQWLAWTADLAALLPLRGALAACLANLDRGVGAALGHPTGLRDISLQSAVHAWRGLAAGASLASAFGETGLAERATARSEALAEAILATFWSADDGAFVSLEVDPDPEDLEFNDDLLLPWHAGLGPPEAANTALRGALVAGADASAVRVRGPLQLAELRCGRPDPAWSRFGDWLGAGPGAPEEAAALLDAAIRGFVGWRVSPDAARIALEPTLPGGLDRVTVAADVRGATVSGVARRGDDGRDLWIELEVTGAPLELELAPFVPAPATVGAAELDGEPFDVHREDIGEGFRLRGAARLEPGRHTFHFAVVPDLLVVLDPLAAPDGRYLGRRLTADGELVLEFETDRALGVAVRLPGRGVARVTGGDLDAADGVLRVEPPAGEGVRRATVRIGFAGT